MVRGQAILFASHLDMAFWEYRDPNLRRLFDNLMRVCGVQKDILLESDPQDYIRKRVDTHLLTHGNQHAILVNNEGSQEIDLSVTVPSAKNTRSATELFTGRALNIDGSTFSITLPPEDGAIIMLE